MSIILCKLCRLKSADKKGSHLVPHFLLKRIENIEGKNGRDYEIGFIIDDLDSKPHFGRSVSPEKLEEVFGELSEDELQNNQHPLIVDYFFCEVCERRFAQVENIYAKTLNTHDDKPYLSGVSCEIGILFWSSIVWRISLKKNFPLNLTIRHSEILRTILNRSLKVEVDQIDFDEMTMIKSLRKLSYKLLRSPNYSNENPSHFVIHPRMKYPYSLVIGEYFLFFSFNGNFNDYLDKSFHGIKDEVFKAPENKVKKEEVIYPIKEQTLFKFNEAMIGMMSQLKIKKLHRIWDKLHVRMNGKGKSMPQFIKNELFEELIMNETKLGRKYTMQDVLNVTLKVLPKHMKN